MDPKPWFLSIDSFNTLVTLHTSAYRPFTPSPGYLGGRFLEGFMSPTIEGHQFGSFGLGHRDGPLSPHACRFNMVLLL